MYASECWDLNSDLRSIKRFSKKVLKYTSGCNKYQTAVSCSKLLLYFKVLKDLLIYSNNNNHYSIESTVFYEFNGDGARRSRVKLPFHWYGAQKQNFCYQTGFRINILQKYRNFFDSMNLKGRLINIMWKYFLTNWTDNNLPL